MNWYVLQVYSGFENKISDIIRELATKRGLDSKISKILVPTHDITQVRYGKKITMKKNFLPGYVLINMDLTEELLHLIRSIPRVSSFIGATSKDGMPFPVTEDEINRLMNYAEDKNNSSETPEFNFEVGEEVHIISGPFSSFDGIIEEIEEDRRKIKVAVSIFGRATPVELEPHQVEKLKK
jgi:transcriptional antiterminator NusG